MAAKKKSGERASNVPPVARHTVDVDELDLVDLRPVPLQVVHLLRDPVFVVGVLQVVPRNADKDAPCEERLLQQ